MIDIHSHVLPGIDDGSRNIQMSLAMLKEAKKQGIDLMFFTPHFYADETDPKRFIERRGLAASALQESIEANEGDYPSYLLGSEVHYYRGIGRSEDIASLCMGSSRYLLLEPPFRSWTPAFLDDVRELRDEQDLKVIIAHIERYLDQDKHLVAELLSEPGIYIQANAESFLERRTRRQAMKMLESGKIDFLGSDCHNLDDRCPNLAPARELIEDKLGGAVLTRIDENSRQLAQEASGGKEVHVL